MLGARRSSLSTRAIGAADIGERERPAVEAHLRVPARDVGTVGKAMSLAERRPIVRVPVEMDTDAALIDEPRRAGLGCKGDAPSAAVAGAAAYSSEGHAQA